MYGLDAISAHNGWQLSALGVSIVFTGLIMLALAISRIHKILGFWDRKNSYYQRIKKVWQRKQRPDTTTSDPALLKDVKESVRQFKLLIEQMGEPFSLPKLIDFSKKCGFLRSYSSINSLLQAKLIIPDGKGYF
ncbi:MAG: OadG family protein, partial [Thermodesulfobacteriota bacterium]|nr:OadG family protein [Thermodesulfobacteriota bacterium]